MDLHAIRRCDGADMVSSSDCTGDRCLLISVAETLAGEVCASTLGDLQDDRNLKVTINVTENSLSCKIEDNHLANTDRAASRTALAVDEDVTFCMRFVRCRKINENVGWNLPPPRLWSTGDRLTLIQEYIDRKELTGMANWTWRVRQRDRWGWNRLDEPCSFEHIQRACEHCHRWWLQPKRWVMNKYICAAGRYIQVADREQTLWITLSQRDDGGRKSRDVESRTKTKKSGLGEEGPRELGAITALVGCSVYSI